MANLQYIGARYVPILYTNPDDNSNDWKAGVTYEALTIVVYNDDSYTSKKAVPDNIGNPAGNPDYWVKTGNYNAGITSLANRVTALENGFNNTIGVYPEYFGAIGDGVTNDRQALQDCIDYCETNGVNLVSTQNSHYAINTPIQITNCKCYFNGATIINNTTGEFAIEINKDINTLADLRNGDHNPHIYNLVIDCNSRGGISHAGIESRLEHVSLLNIGMRGLYNRFGYELVVNDLYMYGDGSTNSIGIDNSTSDAHYTDIISTDVYIGIDGAAASTYTRVHMWIHNGNIYNGSVFARAKTFDAFHFIGCNCDTYSIFVYYVDTVYPRVTMSECLVMYNGSIMPDDAVTYYFYTPTLSNKYKNWQRDEIVNCRFSTPSRGTFNFCNFYSDYNVFPLNAHNTEFRRGANFIRPHGWCDLSPYFVNTHSTLTGAQIEKIEVKYGEEIHIQCHVHATDTNQVIFDLNVVDGDVKGDFPFAQKNIMVARGSSEWRPDDWVPATIINPNGPNSTDCERLQVKLTDVPNNSYYYWIDITMPLKLSY